LDSAKVQADPDRLAQVFANLISNAAKFSPKGKPIELSLDICQELARVTVRDWGPGVPQEFEERLFERFAQADGSDSRKTSGTGLGLSITKAIVERMGGTIGHEPAENGGSRFYFELPIARPSVLVAPTVPPRILVCEDEPDIALLLKKILGFEGYLVDIAANIATAKNLLGERDYKAVTLDLRLGNENGLELLDEIRLTAGSIPVIVVSAIADDARNTLQGGAISIVDWITKPIDETRLLASIQGATKMAPRKRILHVEDDVDLAVMVKALLGDLGSLTNARSLREARDQLEHGSFDLVLLDIGLPDGEGTELLPLVGHTPVIVFSAAEADLCASEKIVANLVKSRATEHELRTAINSVLPAAS
jgi:DNA-binding response OmpR family regulator